MVPEIKAEWIKRLQSGEYKQGRGSLKRTVAGEVSYCCLGVLCEYAKEQGVVDEMPVNQYGDDFVSTFGDSINGRSGNYLPITVMHWAGLTSYNPYAGSFTLSEVNDGPEGLNPYYPSTFEGIAQMVKDHL